MISIVLYGRNDSYGYNLHKRAALSLNCMAELLADNDDEILFVDYNTPNDYPTFPEAIQDTLTEKARARLRVLRVRPDIHERLRRQTRLLALEPISRTVAIRRSNPANRWVLSTNTDMIFVPPASGKTLNEIVAALPDGFYHAPRFEVPELLWEGLDRSKPQQVIDTVREWGRVLHLNEIVLSLDVVLFDGPGDFQLMLRSDLVKYHGFDERMIQGWHVDSNMAKRLSLARGAVGDLSRSIVGYHCDHTRQLTPGHSPSRTQNSWSRFVDEVREPHLPSQARNWGCADDHIEEIRLTDRTSVYIAALRESIGAPQDDVSVVRSTPETFDSMNYDPRHILPFLSDLFASERRDSVVAWTGLRRETFSLFANFWRSSGFSRPIIIDSVGGLGRSAGTTDAPAASPSEMLTRADAFVVDFGAPAAQSGTGRSRLTGLERAQLRAAFVDIVRAEWQRQSDGKPPRRIICINVINTEDEAFVQGYISAGLTPISTRLRHGFARPPTWKHRLGEMRGGEFLVSVARMIKRRLQRSGTSSLASSSAGENSRGAR